MYHWTEDMIRFMIDATEYGSYHRTLARLIISYLKNRSHVCDAGCGLGYLSIALSSDLPKITAVDIKPQAIQVLKKHCREKNIQNIDPIADDIHHTIPTKPYDGMIFCFFGRSEDIFEIIHQQCDGTVVIIKKDYNIHRFSVGQYPTGADDYTHLQSLLDSMEIPYQKQRISLEFGQPFRCFEDIRKFYQCYSRDTDQSVLTDEFLHSRVIETGKPDFPFYMPHRRQIGIVSFESREMINKKRQSL